MELVYIDGKKEPYTLSSIIADSADIKHRHLNKLINKHKERLSRYGKVSFQISPLMNYFIKNREVGKQCKLLNEKKASLEKLRLTSIWIKIEQFWLLSNSWHKGSAIRAVKVLKK